MKVIICLCMLAVVVIARLNQNDDSYDGQPDVKLAELQKPVHLNAKIQSPKGEMIMKENQEYAVLDGVHTRIKRANVECRIVRRGGRRRRICRRIGVTRRKRPESFELGESAQ